LIIKAQTKTSKYTRDYIVKLETPQKILNSINMEGLCRAILNTSEFIKNSKLLRVRKLFVYSNDYFKINLPKLLGKLMSFNRKDKSKFIRKVNIKIIKENLS